MELIEGLVVSTQQRRRNLKENTNPWKTAAMKQGLVMGALVELLSEFAGPSNEGIAFIHDYALNG
jgi:hypothetical protein